MMRCKPLTPHIGGMDVVDLGEETGADALVQTSRGTEQPHHDDHPHDHNHPHDHDDTDDADAPFRSIDHASDTDDEIESIAEEDVAEEISHGPQTARPSV